MELGQKQKFSFREVPKNVVFFFPGGGGVKSGLVGVQQTKLFYGRPNRWSLYG